MARRPESPLIRLARRLRRQPPRPGFAGALQRATVALLPAPRPDPAVARASPALPDPEREAARRRAQRALLDARQAMGGLLGGSPSDSSATHGVLGADLPPDLDRLRAFLEELGRERAGFREEMRSLRTTLMALEQRLVKLESLMATASQPSTATVEEEDAVTDPGIATAVEAPAAVIDTSTPPLPATRSTDQGSSQHSRVEESEHREGAIRPRESAERGLIDRVFAAGTVGTRIELSPTPNEAEIDGIIAALQADPLVEHAEPLSGPATSSLRVTLRAPLRWHQFSAVLERALRHPLGPGDVSWSQGAVLVRRPDAATTTATADQA